MARICRAIVFFVLVLIVAPAGVQGFQCTVSRRNAPAGTSSLLLNARIPLIGRFRKKREVEQSRTIQVGDGIPDVDVEVIQFTEDSSSGSPSSIRDVLGETGASVFVGKFVL